jgi:hypothetical protein
MDASYTDGSEHVHNVHIQVPFGMGIMFYGIFFALGCKEAEAKFARWSSTKGMPQKKAEDPEKVNLKDGLIKPCFSQPHVS